MKTQKIASIQTDKSVKVLSTKQKEKVSGGGDGIVHIIQAIVVDDDASGIVIIAEDIQS